VPHVILPRGRLADAGLASAWFSEQISRPDGLAVEVDGIGGFAVKTDALGFERKAAFEIAVRASVPIPKFASIRRGL
jgi:hypothetical protein